MTDNTAYKHGIVVRMFRDTADENYISARSAFFDQRDGDFWWLSLHAVEKYLKTILLMNGRKTIKLRHDIVKIMREVKSLDSRLVPPPFAKPHISGLFNWHSYPDDKFFKRLNEYGSPDNPYGTYGNTVVCDDLVRVDQLIFWARRHACPHQYKHSSGIIIDRIDDLAQNPKRWIQHGGPLEKIAALRQQDRRRWPLVRLNAAFFPEKRHVMQTLRFAGTNPPIAEWCDRLKQSPLGSEPRRTAWEVLRWVIDSIILSAGDKAQLEALLSAYPAK